MRIGVMTGGGDCPGLNAAIRAVTQLASAQYNAEVVGILDGFDGLITNRTIELSPEHVRGMIRVGGTMLGASARTNPWQYTALKNHAPEDRSEQAYEHYNKLQLDGLIVIGGDGTLRLAERFSTQFGVPVIGVPKTIDNDVHGTDFSIGFDSAVTTVTEAIDKLHTTAESHHRVMLVEVMGRTAGWIALFAGVAGGADIILTPERQYSVSGIVRKIERRQSIGYQFTIAAVAEGTVDPAGKTIYRATTGDPLGKKLGGVSNQLAGELSRQTELEVRSIVLGHLQRGGSPTALDRNIATILGAEAVKALATGQSGFAPGFAGSDLKFTPLSKIATGPRLVPHDHPLLETAENMGIYCGE